MVRVWLGLGANIGDGEATIHRAFELIEAHLSHARLSTVIRSSPMYVEDQPQFWNAAAVGDTELGPLELMRHIRAIEGQLGRIRRQPNGPREIDIDLLAYGGLVLASDGESGLKIPHPRIFERTFVLEPMLELSPNLCLPRFGRIDDMLRTLRAISG